MGQQGADVVESIKDHALLQLAKAVYSTLDAAVHQVVSHFGENPRYDGALCNCYAPPAQCHCTR